jgi:hypothetical protein
MVAFPFVIASWRNFVVVQFSITVIASEAKQSIFIAT